MSTSGDTTHRALVLQGGGALGAYESGVFKKLCKELSGKDGENGRKGNLFDIVAGTSAGAINAAIIVNHVARERTWEGIDEILCNFWRDSATLIPLWPKNEVVSKTWSYWEDARERYTNFFRSVTQSLLPFSKLREESPFLLPAYFFWPDNYGPLASEEAARRYWSWFLFAFSALGTPSVLSPAILQPDFSYYNPFNFLLRYNNAPLVETVRKYWDYERHPIKTSYNGGQPRLLFVTVDIMDSITATFDSYQKEDNIWKTEYEHETHDGHKEKHIIRYNDGLTMEHLLTSVSSHLRHKPPALEAETIISENGKVSSTKRGLRYFWDGFYLSNTPLREVLQAHRDYWHKVRKETVPKLEVYIVNLYPTIEKEDYPKDPDGIMNRVNDVLYHDKTEYDEKVANIVTDYIDLANSLIKTVFEEAKDKEAAKTKIKKIKESYVKMSAKRRGGKRTYGDLLDGRFDVEKVVRIEISADAKNDIYGKAFDFSLDTINHLIDKGYNDASDYFKKFQQHAGQVTAQ